MTNLKQELEETRKKTIKEMLFIKMDYLKWQLREDLVGKYHTIEIEKAEERARGWNAYRDKILEKLKGEYEKQNK